MRLSASGTKLSRSGKKLVVPGLADRFSRPDGRVGPAWTDLADIHPLQYDPARVVDGQLGSITSHDAVPVEPDRSPFGVNISHVGIVRDCSEFVGGDFEVGINWDTPTELATIHQVSPWLFVDPDADPTWENGLAPIWDPSLAIMGIQSDIFDPLGIYHMFGTLEWSYVLNSDGALHNVQEGILPGSAAFHSVPTYGAGVTHNIVGRVVGDNIAMLFDGEEIVDLPIPTSMRERTRMGVVMIIITFDIGYDPDVPAYNVPGYDLGPTAYVAPGRINSWWCRPL